MDRNRSSSRSSSHHSHRRKYGDREREKYSHSAKVVKESRKDSKSDIVKPKQTSDDPAASSLPNKYITEISDKAKQVNLLNAKIQESLAKHGLTNQKPVSSQPLVDPNTTKRAVVLNEFGQTVDAVTGDLITLVRYTPTAKINLRAKRKKLAQAVTSEVKKTIDDSTEIMIEPPITETKHFDPKVKQAPVERKSRQLKFHEPGKFSHVAQTERKKVEFEKLQDKIQELIKRTGIASATKLAMVTIKENAEISSKTADIEWWDKAIIPTQSYASFNRLSQNVSLESIKNDSEARNKLMEILTGITNLIEHPVPRLPPGEVWDRNAIKIFLTKSEQRKIRLQRRKANEQEKQEKILLGLIPPPPPKEAVQDPTKVEAYVRQQIVARKVAHEEANAARKLTPAQKKVKLIKKYTEDTSLGVCVAVYRVWDISNRSKSFKVDQNARQNHMTDMNLVILEGGPKSQKRMKRLLLHRIKWSEDIISHQVTSSKPVSDVQKNKCELIWEGTNGYHNFKEWEFKIIKSESAAIEFLKKHQSDHFWNLAYNMSLNT